MEAEARGEGETLSRHERVLTELAQRYGLNVIEIYREIVSGETIAARPVMQRLLNEVGHGVWSGVLVMEVERLARGDTIDQGIMAQTFKYSGTKIITPMKTYEPDNEYDEEYFEFGLFMSRREYKTINRRLQRGRTASVMEGRYVSNTPPYGYIRKKIENDKGYTLIPLPDEADVVRLIFELYTRGDSQANQPSGRIGVMRICRRLSSLKIKPRKADDWSPGSIRDILINPVYTGKIRWNWRPASKRMVNGEVRVSRRRSPISDCIVVDGLHEAIIDTDTWNLTQELMKQNPPRPVTTKRKLQNPLAGIVTCGKCGHMMVRRPHQGKTKPTLMCPKSGCGNISASLAVVEDHIVLALAIWTKDFRIDYEMAAKKNTKSIQGEVIEKAAKRLEEEILEMEKQLNNIHDFFERGIYSIDMYKERSEIMISRLEAAHADKEVIKSGNRPDSGQGRIRLGKLSRTALMDLYLSINDPKQKNDILKAILEKVVYTKSKKTHRNSGVEEFQIDLYPRIPR